MEIRDLIGKPFMWGGRGPDSFDCYGLVRELYRRAGVITPDYRSPTKGPEIIAAMLAGAQHWEECECAPGTVALIRIPASMHVGYVLDEFRFVHAWERSNGVCVERMSDWRNRFVCFYRPK